MTQEPADTSILAHDEGALEALPRDPLRPGAEVMRLARLGSFHQTRLSFVRTLVRRMAREGWTIARIQFDIDAKGVGAAVYRIDTTAGTFSFVVFAQEIDPDQRTDRVIAEAWDHTFALTEGVPDAGELDRLRAQVPCQEGARMSARDLVLSRANKSVRLFDSVVAKLARGEQPSAAEIGRVGYLVRTTAVYGNGKFGLADYARLRHQGPFHQPFMAQMLTVYLAREFSLDLVEHLAHARAPATATTLAPDLRRAFGVGNATGLGMAPFIVAHAKLMHRWNRVRETAIARVKAVETAGPDKLPAFERLLRQAIAYADDWTTADPPQQACIETLRAELRETINALFPAGAPGRLPERHPWRWLLETHAADASLETQELLNSLILEPYPELVDDLAERMDADETERLDAAMTVDQLIRLIEQRYAWALSIDRAQPEAHTFFWYRSETKEEPRLGQRCCEPGVDREMPLGIGVQVQDLHAELTALDAAERREPLATVLMRRPHWRQLVRRVQALAPLDYAEVRDNLLAGDIRPVDLLRFKLSFFGATKFDPKSDRWTRINLFQGAPLARDLGDPGLDPDGWAFATLPGRGPGCAGDLGARDPAAGRER
jgi:hypothetical protein